MSELRQDPLTGRWVILAPDRARRPDDFQPGGRPPSSSEKCPFCPGRESWTPPEILSRSSQGEWAVRVVPNRYPALAVEGTLEREGVGPCDRMSGVGAHEVIIETPRHDARWPDLGGEGIARVLEAWAERIADLKGDARLRHVTIFRNEGAAAGATLAHPHSQLVAMPLRPESDLAQTERCRDHFERKERCLVCDLVTWELADGARVVAHNEQAVAYTPWAPRMPFEVWVCPRVHASRLDESDSGVRRRVAEVLADVTARLDRALERPAWNLVLHGAGLREGGSPFRHWWVQILPAVVRPGGFEWGTGFHINPVPPEESAAFLRRSS